MPDFSSPRPALLTPVVEPAGHVVRPVVDRITVGIWSVVPMPIGTAAVEARSAGIEPLGQPRCFLRAHRIHGDRRRQMELDQRFGGNPGPWSGRCGRGGRACRYAGASADRASCPAAYRATDDGADDACADYITSSLAALAGALDAELVRLDRIIAPRKVERNELEREY